MDRHTFKLYGIIAEKVRGALGAKENSASGIQGMFNRGSWS